MKCYDCGNDLSGVSKKDKNREHIPMKCLGASFPHQLTHNWITVQAHVSCNSAFSDRDASFRNYVAVLTDGRGNQTALEKAIRNLRSKNVIPTKHPDGRVSFPFSSEMIEEIAYKHMKGSYMHLHDSAFPSENFSHRVLFSLDDDFIRLLWFNDVYQKFLVDLDWIISGHEELFRFRMIRLGMTSPFQFHETEIEDDMVMCVCAMHVYLDSNAIQMIVAIRKDALSVLANNRVLANEQE